MSVSVHRCSESLNPRKAGWCDCGQPVLREQLQRDRGWECEITRMICQGLAIDVEPLNRFAGGRADTAQHEYGHDFPSLERSMERETLDELADARNYVVWKLDAIHRGLSGDEWKVERLQSALKKIADAFEDIRHVL